MNKDLYYFLGIPGNNYHSRDVDKYLRENVKTRFHYILDRELSGNESNLSLIKTLYPNIKVLTVVVNPWTRFYRSFNSLNIKIEMNAFIKLLPKNRNPKIKITQFQLIHQNSENFQLDYFLRSEYIQTDFQNFKKSLGDNSEFNEFQRVDLNHKKHFNLQSREIIKEIYKEDFEYFNYSAFI